MSAIAVTWVHLQTISKVISEDKMKVFSPNQESIITELFKGLSARNYSLFLSFVYYMESEEQEMLIEQAVQRVCAFEGGYDVLNWIRQVNKALHRLGDDISGQKE